MRDLLKLKEIQALALLTEAIIDLSERDIKKACPGADVKDGLPITGSQAANSKASVQKWLSANGLL